MDALDVPSLITLDWRTSHLGECAPAPPLAVLTACVYTATSGGNGKNVRTTLHRDADAVSACLTVCVAGMVCEPVCVCAPLGSGGGDHQLAGYLAANQQG